MKKPTSRQRRALRDVRDQCLHYINIRVARSLKRNGWIVAKYRCSRTGVDRYHLIEATLTAAGRAALIEAEP